MATKSSALEYRQKWLAEIERRERGRVDYEIWSSRDDRNAGLAAERRQVLREVAALNALPDTASDAEVCAAVGL